MGLIPDDKIAEVRDRTDIVAVVGAYVTLKRTGVNHKGLCPFHNEKSPSFNVNAQKQFFHCFGCGKSGDVISFLTEIEGRTFIEIVRELAQKAGVELPEKERSRAEEERRAKQESERGRMVRLHELCADFFSAQLAAPTGAKARAYVESRGISEKVQQVFRVGYAPAGWDALTNYLQSKKVPHELAESTGLVRRRDGMTMPAGAPPSKTTHFDMFVDRVVYALTSPAGEVIGFGGRVLNPDDQPKYKNSPETPIYRKGENLFGLHAAKNAIRKDGRALVVEGNFDVMTLHECGIEYVVAPQGTAITESQVQLLDRFAREVILMLDGDAAGRAATLKVVKLFVDTGLPARIAALRSHEGRKVDPDDLARNNLPKLKELIESAVDAVEYFFDQVASSAQPTVPGKVKAIEECMPILHAVRDPLARDLYIDRLAQLLSVDSGLVRRTLRGGQPAATHAANQAAGLAANNAAHAAAQNAANGIPPTPEPAVRVKQRKLDRPSAQLLSFLSQQPSFLTPEVANAVTDLDLRALLQHQPSEWRAQAAPAIQDAVVEALMSDQFAKEYVQNPRLSFERIMSGMTTMPAEQLQDERARAIAAGDIDRAQAITAQILKMRQTAVQG